MRKLIDKIPLILLSVTALFRLDGFLEPVLLLLISVTLSELTYICPGKTSIIPAAAYGVISILLPQAAIMIPLLVYDIFHLRKYPLLVLYAAGFILAVQSFSFHQTACVIIGIILAVLLQYRTSEAERLQKRLTEQRDESEEVRLLLSEKNKSLIEKQDGEIYMATLKERNRIAREIHDNVGHALTRSILQMGALQIMNKDESLKGSITSIKETLNDAMQSIRSSVHDLHDTTINLRYLINECITPLKESFDVTLDYTISDTAHVNIKLCLLGIIKEAVSNIMKHSNGSAVSISVQEHPAFYQLIITDNGKCTKGISNTGMGLSSMKERAENAGGIFSAKAMDDGFRIFASIPKSA